jgi:hypothetical protein
MSNSLGQVALVSLISEVPMAPFALLLRCDGYRLLIIFELLKLMIWEMK